MNAQASTMFETFQQPRKMISGVCAELADRSGLPVWTVRVAAVFLLLTHWIFALVLYFAAAAWLRAPQPGTWRDVRGDAAGRPTPPPSGWDRDGLVNRFDRLDRPLSRMERAALDKEASLRQAFRDLDR
jgi:phage shock protein PspC (stress-responsive transcriptional regulator)